METIAFDSHKRYRHYLVEDGQGQEVAEGRLEHVRGEMSRFLSRFTPGSPVAVETIGNWYWIVDEIEQARMRPRLVHARRAKVMMGCINKTDRLEVRGLNRLQRRGTLPTVWIPPGELRDKRDLSRTRMFLVALRTRLKSRIPATLAKYGLVVEPARDPFCRRGRVALEVVIRQLPAHTCSAVPCQLPQIDTLDREIEWLEQRMREVFEPTAAVRLLMTMPGVGFLLAVVISLEVGEVKRFANSEKLAAYAGTTPRVHASGGKVRFGALRKDVNQYLKWALVEAAHRVCAHREHYPHRHVSREYERIRQKKGHAKAIGAVARHLAEATYGVLTKGERSREPKVCEFRQRRYKRGHVMSPLRLGQ